MVLWWNLMQLRDLPFLQLETARNSFEKQLLSISPVAGWTPRWFSLLSQKHERLYLYYRHRTDSASWIFFPQRKTCFRSYTHLGQMYLLIFLQVKCGRQKKRCLNWFKYNLAVVAYSDVSLLICNCNLCSLRKWILYEPLGLGVHFNVAKGSWCLSAPPLCSV